MTKVTITEDLVRSVNRCIHSNESTFSYDGLSLPVGEQKGRRFVDIGAIRFIAHDMSKDNGHTERAKRGHKISWGMRHSDRWIFVDDNTVKMDPGITTTID